MVILSGACGPTSRICTPYKPQVDWGSAVEDSVYAVMAF